MAGVAVAARVIWQVVVLRNVVTELRPVETADPGRTGDDPLAAATRLSRNNQANGCLDGCYEFATSEEARHFAALCAGFMKNLSERTMADLASARGIETGGWRNPFLPER